MILGLGTDIIEISRIEKVVSKFGEKFLAKLFTSKEIESIRARKYSAQHIAGRFAAKEAIIKALDPDWNKDFTWKSLEILNGPSGVPEANTVGDFSKKLPENSQIHLSISHSENYATAVAILETR